MHIPTERHLMLDIVFWVLFIFALIGVIGASLLVSHPYKVTSTVLATTLVMSVFQVLVGWGLYSRGSQEALELAAFALLILEAIVSTIRVLVLRDKTIKVRTPFYLYALIDSVLVVIALGVLYF